MSEDSIVSQMTPDLWVILKALEKGSISHNFRDGIPKPTSMFSLCSTLQSLGLASWSESANQEWEDYKITQKGRELLEKHNRQLDS